jgi:hypothetical protein
MHYRMAACGVQGLPAGRECEATGLYLFSVFAWHCLAGPRAKRAFARPRLSSGLPFGGSIFYGGPEFIVDELDNSIKIKGLAARLSLWRAV